MPVAKFRSVSDMPRPERVLGADLIPRIRALWNRAFLLSPADFPRGVTRFSSIEAANQARFDLLIARLRRNASHERPDADRGKLAASDVLQDATAASGGGQDGGIPSAG